MTTEKDIFKPTGVGSITWYLKVIKIHPDNGGINFLTKYKGVDWYSADNAVRTMVYRGYLKENSKPPKKRINYEVTSFGHRYLEEHKAELEGLEILPGGDKLSTGGSIPQDAGKIGAVETGVSHSVGEAPAFKPSVPEPAGKEPIVPGKPIIETSADFAQDVEKSESTPDDIQEPVENEVLDTPLVDSNPQATDQRIQELPEWTANSICITEHGRLPTWTCVQEQHLMQTKEYYFSEAAAAERMAAARDGQKRVVDAAVSLGSEIEKHHATQSFQEQFKTMLGQLMVTKFAEQVTAKEILEFIEGSDNE